MPGVTVIICSMVIGILGGDLGIFIGLLGFIVGIYILISQGLFKVFKGIYRIFTKTIEYKQNSQVRKKPVIIEKTKVEHIIIEKNSTQIEKCPCCGAPLKQNILLCEYCGSMISNKINLYKHS